MQLPNECPKARSRDRRGGAQAYKLDSGRQEEPIELELSVEEVEEPEEEDDELLGSPKSLQKPLKIAL